jgi:hypothetical protein
MKLYDHTILHLTKGDPGPNDEAQGWLQKSPIWDRTIDRMWQAFTTDDPLGAIRSKKPNYANPWDRILSFHAEWKVAPLIDALRPELEARTTWKLAGFGVRAYPLQFLKYAWRKYGCDVLYDNSPVVKKERHVRQWLHNHKHRILLQYPNATQDRLFVTRHVLIVQPSLIPEVNAAAIARCGDGTETVSVRWAVVDGTIDEHITARAMSETINVLSAQYGC